MLRAWWTSPVDYAAQVAYFERRGLLGAVQLLIGACAVLLAVIPVVAQFSVAGPGTPEARVLSAFFTVSGIVWALMWWFGPWPSRRRSIAFIVYADVGIAVVSSLDSNDLAGLFGLNLMVLVSVYAKFFDGPKLLMAHTMWALGCACALSLQIATGVHADPYLAAAKTLGAVAVMVATPIAVHFGVWVLRTDADAAMTDALTGLLNRRGLKLLLGELFTEVGVGSVSTDCVVMVMVIDLDRFKSVNDTYGHAVGDEVIIRTGRRIKSTMRSPALVARVGGEEFVVVEIAEPQRVSSIAERVRDAIAATAERAPVTASIGVTTIASEHLADPGIDNAASLEQAIAHADRAMFAAKGAGGNATSFCASAPPVAGRSASLRTPLLAPRHHAAAESTKTSHRGA